MCKLPAPDCQSIGLMEHLNLYSHLINFSSYWIKSTSRNITPWTFIPWMEDHGATFMEELPPRLLKNLPRLKQRYSLRCKMNKKKRSQKTIVCDFFMWNIFCENHFRKNITILEIIKFHLLQFTLTDLAFYYHQSSALCICQIRKQLQRV